LLLNPTAFALWPFCVYETTNKTAYNFSVLLILIPFLIILNFLNKEESKVICMREFEIILMQTQSLSIKPFNYEREFSFYLGFYINNTLI
jgi:hypothetical protein